MDSILSTLSTGLKFVGTVIDATRQPPPPPPRQFTNNYQQKPRQPPRPNQSASNSNHPGPAPPPYSRFPPSYNESEHGKRDNRGTNNRIQNTQQYRRPNNQRRNQENGSDVHVTTVKIIQNPNHRGPVITKVTTTTAKQQPKSTQNGGQSYKKKQQANKQKQQANKN